MAAQLDDPPTPSQLPPIPASPTYSFASTANPISHFNLPLPPPPPPLHAVLTKADLEASHLSYASLATSAKEFRTALAALSAAASNFGSALESCARLKEARADALGPSGGSHQRGFIAAQGTCTADALLATSGVHHLIANHQQILSETVYRSFEVPLLHELDKWQREVEDENEGYERAVKEQSREIRRLEKEGVKLHKQRRRDVGKLRGHLVELTGKLDGLTTMHGDHARALLRESQEMSVKIVNASCSLVRAEVDIFESLARKGWTGGGLDDVLERGEDLFASEEDSGSADTNKLFSILPPKSILADNASDITRAGHHHRADSLLVDSDRYQSLAGAITPVRDSDSVFSEPIRPRGGGPRPFSPQPIRVDPDEVMRERLEQSEPSLRRLDDEDDNEATPRPGAFKILRRVLDEAGQEEEDTHPWRDEGTNRAEEEDDTLTIEAPGQKQRRWSGTSSD